MQPGDPASGRLDGADGSAARTFDHTDADVEQAILERRVERQLPPAGPRGRSDVREFGSGLVYLAGCDRQIGAAKPDAAREEAVAGESGVQPPGPFGEGAELRRARGEA